MVLNRKKLEELEAQRLADNAIKSRDSKGRKFKEAPGDERLCFQRDKDRIVHCKAFRRLDEKTQVFIAGSGDHYRTRLTHTLEVAQISRDMARRLALNEDLCEAIALAHDLGHPPFGHGGEEVLDEIMSEFAMHFEHNEQSRRIVERLEKVYPDFDGLNLSIEVLDGLIKHQTSWDQSEKKIKKASFEAQVVNIADEIAYTNHDIDDGLRSGILKLEDFENFELWQKARDAVFEKYGRDLDRDVFISRMISMIISMMIEDFCENMPNFSVGMGKMTGELRRFLYDKFYMSPEISKFVENGKMMIRQLFEYYIKNREKIPKKFLSENEEFVIAVKDYVAGMTDGFLEQEYAKLKL